MFRYKLFAGTADRVQAHNADASSTYKMSLNSFADISEEEIMKLFPKLDKPATTRDSNESLLKNSLTQAVTAWDWRAKGAVNTVKNMGYKCGAGYAFSVTAVLETAYYQKNNKRIDLSEQELIDCGKELGNSGCKGGYAYKAFEYVMKNKGLQSESTYPYIFNEGSKCRAEADQNTAFEGKYVAINSNDPFALAKEVVKGVVSSGICMSQSALLYDSGIYNDRSCGECLTTFVSIVGFNELQSQKYWIVRTQNGSNWGSEQGYMKIAREDTFTAGVCGINQFNLAWKSV